MSETITMAAGTAENPYVIQFKIWEEDHFIKGAAYVTPIGGGETKVFEACFDLRPFDRWLCKRLLQCEAQNRVSGEASIIGFIGPVVKFVRKTAKKIGKAPVLSSLVKGARDIVKSDFAKVAVPALAIAVPAIGVPAAAAYATANKAIDMAQSSKTPAAQKAKLGSFFAKIKSAAASANPQVRQAALQNARILQITQQSRLRQQAIARRAAMPFMRAPLPAGRANAFAPFFRR